MKLPEILLDGWQQWAYYSKRVELVGTSGGRQIGYEYNGLILYNNNGETEPTTLPLYGPERKL